MMTEEERFHRAAVDQFTAICNIKQLAIVLGTDLQSVLQEALNWLVPDVAKQANYHLSTLNDMFLNHLHHAAYQPLRDTLDRNPFPDREINRQAMQIKQPYNYNQQNPRVFAQKDRLASIIKNNLPGNQRTRYLARDTSIYDEEQELCNFARSDQTKTIFYRK